jgi:hypothetical protein
MMPDNNFVRTSQIVITFGLFPIVLVQRGLKLFVGDGEQCLGEF